MRRDVGLMQRFVTGLLALWFAFMATGGELVHRCPMHDGGAPHAAATVASHGAHGAHGASAGGHHAATAPGDDAPAHGRSCTCPDASCGAMPLAVLAPRLSHQFGIAVADVRAVFAAPADRHATATPHLTPFATAPPAPALA